MEENEPMIMTILGPIKTIGNENLLGCSLANEVYAGLMLLACGLLIEDVSYL